MAIGKDITQQNIIKMKKIFSLILALTFTISFAAAAETQTQTTFIIGGCSDTYEGSTISAAKNTCYLGGVTEAKGRYYCNSDSSFLSTLLPTNGCSYGKTSWEVGDPVCCPEDYKCEDVNGKYQCVQRTNDCVIWENKQDCIADQCIWLSETSKCVETASDESCGFYKDQAICETDPYNLGKIGVGTDILGQSIECGGKVYSILQEDSKCVWNESKPEGTQCYLNYVAKEFMGSGTGSFECSNTYTLGECIDGKQSVSWQSANKSLGGGTVPEECLIAMGCAGGSDSRVCGDETIKLPGFSLISLLLSILIISTIYLRKVAKLK